VGKRLSYDLSTMNKVSNVGDGQKRGDAQIVDIPEKCVNYLK